MDTKIISEEHRQLNLEYSDVSAKSWARTSKFDLDVEILILDLKLRDQYRDHDRRYVCNRLFQIKNEIESFLRSDGVVIAFLSDKSVVEGESRGQHYRMSNYWIFSDIGVSINWGIREHECYNQVSQDSVEEFTKIANTAENYIEYEDSEFDKVDEIITRGEYGSVCGAVFRSIGGSGNGSLIILPRPGNLKARPEKWLKTVLDLGVEYFPEYLKDHFQEDNTDADTESIPEPEPNTKVIRLCERFPKVARQLQKRHDNRDTIQMRDEHDVQDLLHALLKTEFDDIRAEEYSPSHGGSASRFDFLLKEGKIGIEVKYASQNNTEKKLKKELSEDKEHYRAHPDCEELVCFIYDPERVFGNPTGFEKDISGPSEDLETTVIVSPK